MMHNQDNLSSKSDLFKKPGSTTLFSAPSFKWSLIRQSFAGESSTVTDIISPDKSLAEILSEIFLKMPLKIFLLAIILLVLLPLAIIIGPLIVGTARFIQNIELIYFRARDNEILLEYQYQPTKTVFKQTIEVIDPVLKTAFFPLYLWGLGINVIIGAAVYPKAFLNPFKSLRRDKSCNMVLTNRDISEFKEEKPIYILSHKSILSHKRLYYINLDGQILKIKTKDFERITNLFSKSLNKVIAASKEDLATITELTGHMQHMPLFPLKDNNQFIVREFNIGMPDGAILKTCEIRHKDTEDANDIPHIIYFAGNRSTVLRYENAIMADALKIKAKVIGFHHSSFGQSGVLMSDGEVWHKPAASHHTLVEEAIAQVQRLLDKGVPAGKITLYGHSLGGTIATAVAYHFHNLQKPQRIFIFNDRSLITPTAFATGIILPEKNRPNRPWLIRDYIRFGLAKGLQPVFKTVVMLSGWDFDVSYFAKIPEAYRQYLLARGKADNGQIITDELIPYQASIHKIDTIKNEYKEWKKKQPESMRDNPHKFYKIIDNESMRLHVINLKDLAREDGTTGQDYWHGFVRRS